MQNYSEEDRIIRSALDECSLLFTKWSAPLFAVCSKGKPVLFATCVAVSVNGKSYLLTAAHAIHEIEKSKSSVYIGKQYLQEVPSLFHRTSIDGNDPLDIAVAEVEADFILGNGMAILPESQLAGSDQFIKSQIYCMHGYPLTKNKSYKSLDFEEKNIKTSAFTYAGVRISIPDTSPKKRTEQSHIALSYKRGKNDQGNNVTRPPNPQGMSGGGLWLVPDLCKPKICFLGGILIGWHGSTVISTKVHEVINFITEKA